VSFKGDIDAAIAELLKRKVSLFDAAPPLWRLLWFLGIEVPPPLFMNSIKYGFLWATYSGPVISLVAFTFLGLGEAMIVFLPGAFISGFVIGIIQYRKRKRLKLPTWSEFIHTLKHDSNES